MTREEVNQLVKEIQNLAEFVGQTFKPDQKALERLIENKEPSE